MDELLTTDQFKALTGKVVDYFALAGATSIVRDFCGWSITSVADVVQQLDSDGGRVLQLPCLHVTDVSSVVASGTDRWGQPYPQPLATDWQWYSDGTLEWCGFSHRGWLPGARRYAVTYSGGFDEVPAAVQMVVCAVAERVVAPSAIHQKLSNVGGIQTNTTYSVNTDSNGLTDMEKAVLSSYRIKQSR